MAHDKVRIGRIYPILKKHMPTLHAPIEELMDIEGTDPFRILIATILSSRTNDRTTIAVAKRLFSKIKGFDDFEKLTVQDIDRLIYPVGFHKTKANQLSQIPKMIREHFDGHVPDTIDKLTELPGVGRKTANIILNSAFGKPGLSVDTHVHRITNRWGYVSTKTPAQTETELRRTLPKRYWPDFSELLVALGQTICRPTRPMCSVCPLSSYCQKKNVKKSD